MVGLFASQGNATFAEDSDNDGTLDRLTAAGEAELDAGNAAMVADAEKELSISSSYSSGSVNSGRSDEEIEEEEMEHSMPLETTPRTGFATSVMPEPGM